MKLRVAVILPILCCFNFIFAQTGLNPELEKVLGSFTDRIIENRIYIKPGCVHVGSNAIFIKIENDLVPVSCISVDNEGIYVDVSELAYLIRCSTCKRFYDPDKQYSICPHDDKPRKK